MDAETLAKALSELGYVLERAENPHDIRTWPEDEAEAYREFRWREGSEAANALRIKKLALALEFLTAPEHFDCVEVDHTYTMWPSMGVRCYYCGKAKPDGE